MPSEGASSVSGSGAASGSLEYEIVDVFAAAAYAGNPLAVVYGADALKQAQLQALAREFNLSETTFPVAMTADDQAAGADYRVRIFTPATEIPFAGHPTLGTAWALVRRGDIAPGDRRQACGAGLIGVRLPADESEPVELSATPGDHARQFTDDETAELASLVSLSPDDVTGRAYVAGCGLTWTYLPIAEAALSRARSVGRGLSETSIDLSGLLDPVDGIDVFVATAGSGGVSVRSRCFVPGFGIPEDPATGSAAAGLGLVLVAAGLAAPDGETSYEIEQGVDMGRPSQISGRVEATDGVATRVHVSGRVVPVARGTIRIP
jgi:trans-2,3-dihydro-3-hydroxyanthranilate isomerase